MSNRILFTNSTIDQRVWSRRSSSGTIEVTVFELVLLLCNLSFHWI